MQSLEKLSLVLSPYVEETWTMQTGPRMGRLGSSHGSSSVPACKMSVLTSTRRNSRKSVVYQLPEPRIH